MTGQAAIWNTMIEYVPRKQWISIGDLFAIVEHGSDLDSEDLELDSSHVPRWKLNVRRALMDKKRAGSVQGRRKTD